MKRLKILPKYVALGIVMLTAADSLLMVLGAALIENGTLAYGCMKIWSLLSLVAASAAVNLYCAARSGVPMNAYGVGAFYFLLFVLPTTAFCDSQMSLAAMVKAFTALICGALIGNFFGISRHNRLRKIGKKKRLYTK